MLAGQNRVSWLTNSKFVRRKELTDYLGEDGNSPDKALRTSSKAGTSQTSGFSTLYVVDTHTLDEVKSIIPILF